MHCCRVTTMHPAAVPAEKKEEIVNQNHSQQFRDNSGRRTYTRRLKTSGDKLGGWMRDAVNPASTNLALEAAMRPILAELTIPQRDAVRLVMWERMSQHEAAAQLKITQQGVAKHLELAYRKIRKALIAASGVDEDVAPSALYRAVRQWLTPNQQITATGEEDHWEDARCQMCSIPLAKYLANPLGFDPFLVGPECHLIP